MHDRRHDVLALPDGGKETEGHRGPVLGTRPSYAVTDSANASLMP